MIDAVPLQESSDLFQPLGNDVEGGLRDVSDSLLPDESVSKPVPSICRRLTPEEEVLETVHGSPIAAVHVPSNQEARSSELRSLFSHQPHHRLPRHGRTPQNLLNP